MNPTKWSTWSSEVKYSCGIFVTIKKTETCSQKSSINLCFLYLFMTYVCVYLKLILIHTYVPLSCLIRGFFLVKTLGERILKGNLDNTKGKVT